MAHHRFMVAGTIVAASLALAPAAMALGPTDFAVNIPDGPSVGGPPADFDPTKNCTPRMGTSLVTQCDGTYAWSDSATPMTGTVTRISDGLAGTIALVCDWNMTNTMGLRLTFTSLPPTGMPTQEVTSFGGQGGQSCAWEMTLGPSTLIGTVEGTTTLSQPTPTTGRFVGNLKILIVGGTGDYAQANGSGEMTQSQDFPLTQPSAPAVNPGRGMSSMARAATERMLAGAVANQAGSSMTMTIRKGKAKASFLVPKGTITKSTKWKVHLAATPRSTCVVTARKGNTTVKLGTLRDTKGTGSLVGSRLIGTQLKATGNWKLSASCRAPKVAKAFSTSARLKMRS